MAVRAVTGWAMLHHVLMTSETEIARARHARHGKFTVATRAATAQMNFGGVRGRDRGVGRMACHAGCSGLVVVLMADVALQSCSRSRSRLRVALRTCNRVVTAVVKVHSARFCARVADGQGESLCRCVEPGRVLSRIMT